MSAIVRSESEKRAYVGDEKGLSGSDSPVDHEYGEAAAGTVEDFGEKKQLKYGLFRKNPVLALS